MVVFVRDPDPQANPPLNLNPSLGVKINRDLTHWFIQQDPTTVVLVPRVESKTPSGATKLTAQPPRPAQVVKLVYQGGAPGGVQTALDGKTRKYDFVLVAEWDATVRLYDFWEDPGKPDHFWEVVGLEPYNDYEVKAAVRAIGRELLYGG